MSLRSCSLLVLLVALSGPRALAQTPDRLGGPQPIDLEPDDPDAVKEEPDELEEPEDAPVVRPVPPSVEPAPAVVPQPVPAAPTRAPVPPLPVRTLTDADLEVAWQAWHKVESGTDFRAEQAARAELVKLKQLVGASSIETWAMGLIRAAEAHAEKENIGAAVEIARTAVELAPDLPSAWVGLSRVYFLTDPADIPRYVSAMFTAVVTQTSDPRYARPLLADLGAALLLALVLTAVAVVLVLVVRRGAYFLFDFHFLFPRAVARWQTTALAVMILSLPLVFRTGVAPTLLALFAAVTLYVSLTERAVAAVFIALLGLVPAAGGALVERTAFAETPAEDLYLIERGGPGTEPLIARWGALAAEDKVTFPERFVLGRAHLRRGQLTEAMNHLRGALVLNPEHVGARINLATVFFMQGDLENSRSILERVVAETRHPVALFNLGRVFQRRVAVYGDSAAVEIDRALENLSLANQLDPRLPRVGPDEAPPEVANGLLHTVPLEHQALLGTATDRQWSDRVRSQLSQVLLGDVPEPVAPLYPGLLAGLLLAFGLLSRNVEAARPCQRCGNPVSRRNDPEVSAGSLMCTGCVNVFAKKNVVAPSMKVRKQLEVARYQSRIDRTSFVLGAVWSGMGHVFAGLPVRGAVYGFLFIAVLLGLVLRHGVLRTPYDPIPVFVKVVPLFLLGLTVYLLTLRGLRRTTGE